MSALTDKYAALKAEVINTEGWLYVHLNWLVISGACFLAGWLLGHFWR